MKNNFRILFLSLFIFCQLSAQENEWKNVGSGFQQKTMRESSAETLKNSDSLVIEICNFNIDEKVEKIDFTKLKTIPVKTSFENFKQKIKLNSFNPELKKNSEYQLKSITDENASQHYSLHLDDSITEIQIQNIKEYLQKNFKIEKIEFLSKKKSAQKAAEMLGVKSEDLFEGTIFPASLEIECKTKINLKNLQRKYSNIINDIVNNDLDSGIVILRITT